MTEPTMTDSARHVLNVIAIREGLEVDGWHHYLTSVNDDGESVFAYDRPDGRSLTIRVSGDGYELDRQKSTLTTDEEVAGARPEPGKVVVVASLPACDFCDDGTEATYDFRTVHGPWANGCENHYRQHRANPDLGVGHGQLLITETGPKDAGAIDAVDEAAARIVADRLEAGELLSDKSMSDRDFLAPLLDDETPAEELGRLRRQLSELGPDTPEHRDTLDRIAVLTRRQAEGHDITTAAGRRARSMARQDARLLETGSATYPPDTPVDVKTSEYEFAHGRKPRGIGTWAFQLGDDDRPEHTYWHNGSYSAGRKAAIRAARWRGKTTITVLP